jgi:DNA ligase-1
MRDFSQLLDGLVYTRSRNAKLKLIGDYLKRTPDPDRGYALAALTGELNLPAVKSAAIRAITEERVDPVLFYMSRDYVGDLAETVSLLWPKATEQPADIDDGTLRIPTWWSGWRASGARKLPVRLRNMLDHLDASGRYALLKLATGELRIGVNARIAKLALAQAFGTRRGCGGGGVARHRAALFAPVRLGGREGRAADGAQRPRVPALHARPPARRAAPVDGRVRGRVEMGRDPGADRPRGGETRLYSRAGDDITRSFPKSPRRSTRRGCWTGSFWCAASFQGRGGACGAAASFNALQQRLGRKIVSAKMLSDYPAFVRPLRHLIDGEEDVRPAPGATKGATGGAGAEARSGAGSTCRADRSRKLRRTRADKGRARDARSKA